MKKVLFLAIIILGLSSCMTEYKPINEVKMDVIEQKFTQDTTEFDSYVKIIDNTYYFYTLDDKELYAKVGVRDFMVSTGLESFGFGFLTGIIITSILLFVISNINEQ